jgi:hypothetical protein
MMPCCLTNGRISSDPWSFLKDLKVQHHANRNARKGHKPSSTTEIQFIHGRFEFSVTMRASASAATRRISSPSRLSSRCGWRCRFTRLTNAFSKKVENRAGPSLDSACSSTLSSSRATPSLRSYLAASNRCSVTLRVKRTRTVRVR